jgi:hypothetical protein
MSLALNGSVSEKHWSLQIVHAPVHELVHIYVIRVVNSTKTPEFTPIFLNFFRSLYAPVSDHVTPALILAELPH